MSLTNFFSGRKIYPIDQWFALSWLLVTVVYLLFVAFSPQSPSLDHPGMLPSNIIEGVIGLFVPFGFYNLFAGILVGIQGWLALGIFSAFLLFADDIAARAPVPPGLLKYAYNLALLFAVTVVVDLLIWGKWNSFLIVQASLR